MASSQSRVNPSQPRAQLLPLEAVVDATSAGWLIRLPLRSEVVTVTKEPVVREMVRVWRHRREETAAVETTVRSERLTQEYVASDEQPPRP